jgi:probable rRNA maturation factor
MAHMPAHILRRAPASPRVQSKHVRNMANEMLRYLDLFDADLSIVLTNDNTIQRLNREYRHKDTPTDVLSFQVDIRVWSPSKDAPRLLGDIVISLDTAARQARSRKRPLLAELRMLLAHGILHLLGFDHAKPPKKKEMDAWTRRLVRSSLIASASSR